MTTFKQRIQTLQPKSIFRHLVAGWAIGMVVVSFFILTADSPHPEWGAFWMVRPLILTPLISATGMLAFFLRSLAEPKSKIGNTLLFFSGLMLYPIALRVGIVLGFDGTMWN
ncbi:MAG: potassium transporter KefB [Bacteroidetes bacterium]|nr:potassium transporter KefB [Bacteroidota bacterium]